MAVGSGVLLSTIAVTATSLPRTCKSLAIDVLRCVRAWRPPPTRWGDLCQSGSVSVRCYTAATRLPGARPLAPQKKVITFRESGYEINRHGEAWFDWSGRYSCCTSALYRRPFEAAAPMSRSDTCRIARSYRQRQTAKSNRRLYLYADDQFYVGRILSSQESVCPYSNACDEAVVLQEAVERILIVSGRPFFRNILSVNRPGQSVEQGLQSVIDIPSGDQNAPPGGSGRSIRMSNSARNLQCGCTSVVKA